MQETLVHFLGKEDPLEKGQATHSSILGLPLWLSWSGASGPAVQELIIEGQKASFLISHL